VLISKLGPGEVSEQELRAAVANGTDAVFRQCLEIGFFHADPHPGNLFILPGGKICFIDCGMTGRIDPRTAGQLADLVQSVLAGDLDRVMEITLAIGDSDPALMDDRQVRADVWEFIAQFENATLQSLDVGALLHEFFEKVRRNNLSCPADIVFLVKAITTIQSVGQRLVPEFDIVQHVRPHVESLVKRRYGFRALRRRLTVSVQSYSELLETMPRQVRTLLQGLQRSRLTVNLEHRGLDKLTETIDRASGHIAHSVFIASLIMGSAILILADTVARERGALSIIAGITFVFAVTLAVFRLLYGWWKG
jgi:ubiquinone biosynthesis protein